MTSKFDEHHHNNGIFLGDAIHLSATTQPYTHPPYGAEEKQKRGPSSIGVMTDTGVVLTASEAEVYRRIKKVVAENKQLKQAMRGNSLRLQSHYEDCVKWKNKHQAKENDIRQELAEERKKSQKLQSTITSYNKALDNSSLSSSRSTGTSFVGELMTYSEKLREVLSMSLNDEEEEVDYVTIRRAVQDTQDTIKELTTIRTTDPVEFEPYEKKLTSIQDTIEKISTNYGDRIKENICGVQDTVRRYSKIPFILKGDQHISLSQYLELQAKFDMILTENEQVNLHLEDLMDVSDENKTLTEKLSSLEQNYVSVTKELKDKNDKIISMEHQIVDLQHGVSVEIVNFNDESQMKIKELDGKVQKLQNEKNSLQNDLNETIECFEKMEDDICAYQHQIEELKRMLAQSKNQSVDVATVAKDKSPPMNEFLISENPIDAPKTEQNEEIKQLSMQVEEKNHEITSLKEKNAKVRNEAEKLKEEGNKNIEHLKKKCEECDKHKKKEKQLQKREARDADKIEMLLKENTDMKAHIQDLQKIIDEKIEKNGDVDTLALASMQFVNKSDACDSLTDTTNIEQTVSTDRLYSETDDECPNIEDECISVETKAGSTNQLSAESTNERLVELEAENKSLHEKIQHLEETYTELQQKFHTGKQNMQKLLEENTDMDHRLKSLSQRREVSMDDQNNMQNRFTELGEKCSQQEAQMKEIASTLQREREVNREFQTVKINLEQQVHYVITDANKTQQQLDSTHQSLETAERSLEKSRRDYQKLWQNFELKMKHLGDIENQAKQHQQRGDKLTAEVVGAKDLINQKDMEIAQMNKKLHIQDQQFKKMANDLDTLPVLQMQVDVYQNDFNAEREAREKQQADLLQARERLNELMLENHRLREEVKQFGNPHLAELQRRHAGGASNLQHQYEPVNRPNVSQYGGGRLMGAYPQEQHHQGRNPAGSGYGGGNSMLYGRGSEQRRPARTDGNQPVDREDTEQRNCPKCEKLFPDLDTLQIHLMECLDN